MGLYEALNGSIFTFSRASNLEFCTHDDDITLCNSIPSIQAKSQCAEAQGWLETVCKYLAPELDHFDLRKEKELREILIDYSTTKAEHYEQVGFTVFEVSSSKNDRGLVQLAWN